MGVAYDKVADLVRTLFDFRISGPPVLDCRADFANGFRFAGAWREIRDEALTILAEKTDIPRFHDIMPEQADISANDGRDWRMYILKAYGVENAGHMAACPALSACVANAPEVLSASLSFLAPHKYIPPHRGPFRGVLRFYLVLSMPILDDGNPAAILKIANTEFRLNDGQYLLWDDTYVHEVRNESDDIRVVLLLDVWRPRMPFDMRILSRLLIWLVRTNIMIRGIGQAA